MLWRPLSPQPVPEQPAKQGQRVLVREIESQHSTTDNELAREGEFYVRVVMRVGQLQVPRRYPAIHRRG